MSGPSFTATVQLGPLNKALAAAGAAAADLSPVFRGRVVPAAAEALRKQFDTRGAHLGTPWAPLSPTTMRLRTRVVGKQGAKGARTVARRGRAKFGFAEPLRDTGRLWRSLAFVTHPEGVRDVRPLRMAFGTTVPYAAAQQDGFQTRLFGRGPVRQVPARPIIPAVWPASITDQWAGWIADHVERAT